LKKIFHLQKEGKNPDRLLEAIKHEIRKYLKRERGKKLPKDAVFWDFDCRFGKSSDDAQSLKVSEITSALDKASADNFTECYVEIISKASFKAKPTTGEEE
jgi:hypothetical protein